MSSWTERTHTGFKKTQLLELFVPCFFLRTCNSCSNNRDEQVLQVLFMRHLLSPIALPHPCLKQSRGYNLSYVALTLISSFKKAANNSKQTQIREGNIYLAFEQPGHSSFICILWTTAAPTTAAQRLFALKFVPHFSPFWGKQWKTCPAICHAVGANKCSFQS